MGYRKINNYTGKEIKHKNMDYEKAYKESFEAAKGLHDAGDALTKKQMEIVFPELRESEDDRIRKALIGHLKAGVDFVSNGVTKAECIAWLEKQKEQKPESCDCSRDEESYTNGIHHVLMNPEAYGLIKQKPAEQLGGTFTSYDMAKTFTEGQNYVIDHPEKFGLCKHSEWSEEDEYMAYFVNQFLEYHELSDPTAKSCKKWFNNRFKSLRNRVGKEFLQPHWKPSEEQMEALAWYSGNSGVPPTGDKAIKSLYNDLKKLM